MQKEKKAEFPEDQFIGSIQGGVAKGRRMLGGSFLKEKIPLSRSETILGVTG